jgi:hypothetical protein
MLMEKQKCNFIGCGRDAEYKETYKVLDSNLGLYSFTTNLCTKHFWEIHNFKEKVIGDFSVFFKENPEKSYHL